MNKENIGNLSMIGTWFGDGRFYLAEPCRVVTPQVTQEKNRFWGIQSRILLEPDFNGDCTTRPLAC
jgi:hypothetical protein